MDKGLAMLYSGNFNNMHQEWQSDGSVIITLSNRGSNRVTTLHVKDLYAETEQLLSSKEVSAKEPAYMLARLKEAQKDAKPT